MIAVLKESVERTVSCRSLQIEERPCAGQKYTLVVQSGESSTDLTFPFSEQCEYTVKELTLLRDRVIEVG